MHSNAAFLALNGCILAVPKGAPRNYRIFSRRETRNPMMLRYEDNSRWVASPLSIKQGEYNRLINGEVYVTQDWDYIPDDVMDRMSDKAIEEFLGIPRGWI
jgi:hypothetical protein